MVISEKSKQMSQMRYTPKLYNSHCAFRKLLIGTM